MRGSATILAWAWSAFLAAQTPSGQAAPDLRAPASPSRGSVVTRMQAATMPLAAAAVGIGARVSWDPLTATGFLERGGHRASFKLGSPLWVLDGTDLLRLEPVGLAGGAPVLPDSAAAALAAWFARKEAERASMYRVAAILIDPGHGGRDPGAIAEHVIGGSRRRIFEKDIALAVALRTRDRLMERWPDRRVLMTRDSDIYPTLEERVEIANSLRLGRNEAVIFISIHANASFNRNARGFEVWYLNPDYRRQLVDGTDLPESDQAIVPILNAMLEEEFTMESVLLAQRILDGMGAEIGNASPSRGLRAEEWFVVRNARMPSVLVEVGFLTNAQDAALLADPDYLRKLGDGIYTGIVDFVDYFEQRKGPDPP
ncbi:MAG TPA: N-acetylmuramoyl-L-alanine amidase [Magnetospirillaceae bacterium]|nr:N-acetylmuramoyl-L-alanine amidase [Magnetospirillaceae bacterium]